jgi:hypothetical protein
MVKHVNIGLLSKRTGLFSGGNIVASFAHFFRDSFIVPSFAGRDLPGIKD